MIRARAQAQAHFIQSVTITDPGQTWVFQGSGDDAAMLSTQPYTGQDSYKFDNTHSLLPVTLSFLFQFSTKGSAGPFYTSGLNVSIDNEGTDYLITSEDGKFDDFNDTLLFITVEYPISLGSPSIDTVASPEALTSRSGLRVSNDGIDISINEFAGNSTTSDFAAHISAWRQIAGRVTDHKTPGNWQNYLVMEFLLSGSTTPGLENATMMMSATITYVRYFFFL